MSYSVEFQGKTPEEGETRQADGREFGSANVSDIAAAED